MGKERLEFCRKQRAEYGNKLREKIPPVRLYDNSTGFLVIGNDCYMDKTVTLGLQGFGYERDENGVPLHIPHIGGLIIGDRVDIFAHTNVCRGTVNDTSIGNDTKIDALCQIAHNVTIGERVIICAGTIVGGSSIIESDVFIGLNVTIIPKVRIGAGAYIGAGAVIIRDVPAGAKVVGNPGRILDG